MTTSIFDPAELTRDAIAVHDAECCTAASPCSTRVKLEQGFHGSVGVNSRELPEAKFASGNGHGKGPVWATEKQVGFLLKLISERDMISLLSEDRDLCAFVKTGGQIQKSAASKLIETLLHTAYAAKVSTNGFSKDRAATAPAEQLCPGIYRVGEQIARVQISKQGRAYALLLDIDTQKFIFTSGAIKSITEADRLSLDEAKAFGKDTGICCRCGATLTDETSVAEGIGPICSSKGSWA